ncbi:MAG: SUMF1/EgtB/PvdO family nonheme iron enzyme [bacterium]|nr:SUMF1/EgtB/PvdO family nonheme iron enzyme [bacterium]
MMRAHLTAGEHFGAYRIVRELGHGGMGTVYEAVEAGLDRRVALKILSPMLATDRVYTERFMREARAMACVNHRNIVCVYAVGEHDGKHFIALEYVHGKTIAELIDERGPLKLSLVLDVAEQVGEALAEAHNAGIMHRDIKPHNIMVTPDGLVKVMDFGLAKGAAAGPHLTAAGTVLGTPRYMSPEQIQGKPADARSDLYSLGITLFEMLAGRVAFDARNRMGLMRQVVGTPLPRVPAGDAGIDRLIQRLAAKAPGARYATAEAFLHDLQAIQHRDAEMAEAETVIAPAPRQQAFEHPQPPEAETTLPRSAGLLVALVVGLAILLGALGLGVWWRLGQGMSADPRCDGFMPPPVAELQQGLFTGVRFVRIPAGTFAMGSPEYEKGRGPDETLHDVQLTRDYWMGVYEVTQEQWAAVMGENPSLFTTGADRPVENVSWYDCQAFITKLNGLEEGVFRLPTEAEWEYACRAGTDAPFAFGCDLTMTDARLSVTGDAGTAPVGSHEPNAWGLHDMHGNVWEWCMDGYAVYAAGAQTDPIGPPDSARHVLRGGGWADATDSCRSACRYYEAPEQASVDTGFRLVREVD